MLQVIFRKRATKYMVLLRKMTCKDKASYGSSPLCTSIAVRDLDTHMTSDAQIHSWKTRIWHAHKNWLQIYMHWDSCGRCIYCGATHRYTHDKHTFGTHTQIACKYTRIGAFAVTHTHTHTHTHYIYYGATQR